MPENRSENTFLNENIMRAASVVSAACGLVSVILLSVSGTLTLLALFEKLVKIGMTLALFWGFSRFHWDMVRGMMGGMLFCLLYQESFLVLGSLWGETADFDSYLIMGVEGSLYLASESMSFLLTMIITVNHFIIAYSRSGSLRNVLFNQITIGFKILLYLLLLAVDRFLDLPMLLRVNTGLEYAADLAVVVMLICIESQLDNFKTLRQELLREKREKGAAS